MGHSHGAPTSRYVASVSPEMVASVTSVGGVNRGSEFADFVRGAVPSGSFSEWLVTQGFNTLSRIISGVSGDQLPANSLAALESLTTAKTTLFNQTYPEGLADTACGDRPPLAENGVYYYSWSGTGQLTNMFDISDYPLSLTGLVFNDNNDGLVSRCSSHLGRVIKDNYNMNHLDEVNQTVGIVSWFETNPITVYRRHINRLSRQGL
ncbi:hypothetical protein [Shewanella marina]|uniref:hypothetical protein n=1 Tax=Shewanella marina TaxID=487319 RepID=UPI004032D610